MHSSLRSALADGATVLTREPRHARLIRLQYAQSQRDSVWRSPVIVARDVWLRGIHEALQWSGATEYQRVLLSPQLENAWWQKIIHGAEYGRSLLQAVPAAGLALQSWRRIHDWHLPKPWEFEYPSDDTRAFAEWARDYEVATDGSGCVDLARLQGQLLNAVAQRAVPLPERIVALGLHRASPAEQALFVALRTAGVEVTRPEYAVSAEMPQRLIADDVFDEITRCAQWLHTELEQAPRQRIAVVAPNLRNIRRELEAVFDDLLAPSRVRPGSLGDGAAYRIESPAMLSETDVARTALRICTLAARQIASEDLTALLTSPYITGATEHAGVRALFDVWLRKHRVVRRRTGALPRLLQRFTKRSGREDAALHAAFVRMNQALDRQKSRRPSDWAFLFGSLLEAFGWPGDSLQASDTRAAQSFRNVIEQCAGFDLVWNDIDSMEAVSTLRTLVSRTAQPAAAVDTPILVTDLTDLSGLSFDRVRVLGLSDEVWPQKRRPDPFIPHALQREHGLPHASAATINEEARQHMRSWREATARLTASAPEREADHPLGISPLIAHWPEIAETAADSQTWSDCIRRAAQIETLDDAFGPGFAAGHERGGTYLFKLQSSCPFRAFAEIRLDASVPETPEPALDQRDWGSLVHLALQAFWEQTGDSATLARTIETGELDRVIDNGIDKAFETHAERRGHTELPGQYRAIEQQRLRRRLREWLTIESERSAFKVVGIEQKLETPIEFLSVQTKSDRIDRLPDGSQILIDYKTGKVRKGDWFGDRPADPQLPLYALEADNLAAVVFAQLQPGETRFYGIARDDECLPGVKGFDGKRDAHDPDLTWTGLKDYWYQQLSGLAREYQDGVARVDPAHPSVCKFCELATLCRIDEKGGAG